MEAKLEFFEKDIKVLSQLNDDQLPQNDEE